MSVDDKLFIQLVALLVPFPCFKGVKRIEARLALSLSTKSIKIVQINVQNLQPNRMVQLEC
jgi:lauroyl/myristoyl acyltransferase